MLRNCAVLLTCLALAGCGDSSDSDSSDGGSAVPSTTIAPSAAVAADSASPVAGPSSTGEPRLSPDALRKLAAAGLLQKTDLPGWSASPIQHNAGDDPFEQDLYRCLGVPAQRFLARNYGTAFTKDKSEIDTSVDIVESAAMAHDTAQAARGAKGPECFGSEIAATSKNDGAALKGLTVAPVVASIPGADEVFAFHITAKILNTGGPVDIYILDASVGRTELTVSEVIPGGTVSSSEVDRLGALVVARVKAAGA